MKLHQLLLILCVLAAFLATSCDVDINVSTNIYLYPRDLNFGSVNPGEEKSITLEILNAGASKLNMHEIVLVPDSNTDIQEMYIDSAIDNNNRMLLMPLKDVVVDTGDFITVTFIFKPLDTMAKSATLAITHNAGNVDEPLEKVITGNSSSLNINPTSLVYNRISQGLTQNKNLTIVNSSSEPIKIYSMSLSGSPDFKIESNSGFTTLNPSDSRTVKISFTPSITGLIEGTLSINHDSAGSPTTVAISGVGVPEENRPPAVRNAMVTPNIVKGDGTELVLFTAEISDDNGFADIKSVTIDVSSLNGNATQEMYDDGTNGDVTPDDKIFSFQFLVPSSLTPQGYKAIVTATDYSIEKGTGECYLRIYSGNKIYVSDSKGNDSTGNGSISAPYKTIQKGIDKSDTGDWVVVQDGTYKGAGNRDLRFNGKEIILQSENGAAKTIIDCEGTSTAHHIGFTFVAHETASAVIDGFTIINGYTDNGAGIYCANSSPTIQNCVIMDCTADGSGGAIYGTDLTGMLINGNVIRNNKAYAGAGIYLDKAGVSIQNNSIYDNMGTTRGGGIYINATTKANVITGNDIIGNSLASSSADIYGAGIYYTGRAPIISNNDIEENSLRSNTGSCYGAGLYANTSIVVGSIDNNNFVGNTIHSNSDVSCGGGIYVDGQDTIIRIYDNDVMQNEVYSNESNSLGGGIFVMSGAKPEIKFNNISENLVKSRAQAVYGGGIYSKDSQKYDFTDNNVSSNSAISLLNYAYGGGIFLGNVSGHFDIKDCEVKYNYCSVPSTQRIYGSGICVDKNSIVVIEDSDVSENSAHMSSYAYGGGVFISDNSNVTISESKVNDNYFESVYYCYGTGVYCGNNTFVNFANSEICNNTNLSRYDSYGGGIYFRQGAYSVVNCKINNNVHNSIRYAYGAGVYCYNNISLTFTSCEFVNNYGSGSTCHGGAVYAYGSRVNLTINNSLIADNTLDSTDYARGGAIYAYYSLYNLHNCTVANNNAFSDTGNAFGGAIFILYTYLSTSFNNTIFWNNYVTSRFGIGSPDGHEFYIQQDRVYIIIINNCLYSKLAKNGIESVYDPFSLTNPNLGCVYDKDPYFVDANAGNYRLQHTNIGYPYDSSCIDRGNDSLLSSSIVQDLDGNPRYVDGDKNGSAQIDIGCYEKQN